MSYLFTEEASSSIVFFLMGSQVTKIKAKIVASF